MNHSLVVKLAEIKIEIHSIYDHRDFFRDYICNEAPEVVVKIQQTDIDNEKSHSLVVTNESYLETLAIYRKICEKLIYKDVLLFHGSCISYDGVGYLFIAKSGTGKSTHTRYWRKRFPGSYMVNDDKPLIRIEKDRVTAYGTPWDGKHHLSENTSVPLKNIIVLRRSKTNQIFKKNLKDVYSSVFTQIYSVENLECITKQMELIDRLIPNVSFYELGCNLDEHAAEVAYEGMKCI